MANTTVIDNNRVIKFRKDFFREYVRDGRFDAETSTTNNGVITIKQDKKIVSIPLVARLSNQGKSGSSTLRGNGEALSNYEMRLTPTYHRNSVEYDKEEGDKPAFELMTAARPALMDWAMELKRDQTILAMGAVSAGGTYVDFGNASQANLDAWLVDNSDRVLFGADTGHYSGDFSADIAKIAVATDRATGSIIQLLKTMAKNARPRIRPVRIEGAGAKEWFIAYCDSYVFRDIKSDLKSSHESAMPRSRDNIIFQDGDLMWDGVIIKEVPEISDFIDGGSPIVGDDFVAGSDWSYLATAEAASGRVSPIFFCGQQAVGFGLGQRPDIIVDPTWDYRFQPGVAVECKHDIDKAFFNDDIQHGMVTGFVAAPIAG
jgi:hypothetical protein